MIVVMTSRTMFEDAEDRRERECASFPVCIEDRVVDRDPAREDGACARTRSGHAPLQYWRLGHDWREIRSSGFA